MNDNYRQKMRVILERKKNNVKLKHFLGDILHHEVTNEGSQ